MQRTGGTRLWAIIAFVSVTGALGSLLGEQTRVGATVLECYNDSNCGCDAQQEQMNCSPESGAHGQCVQGLCACNPGWTGPHCENATGACCGVDLMAGNGNGNGTACSNLTEAQCLQFSGTYAGNGTTCASGICEPSPTPTETSTPTETPTPTETGAPTETPTRVPQGGACTEPSQCVEGLFCSDEVCCDTACADPGESCAVEGFEGTCILDAAPAPAASSTGLLIGLALLVLTAFAALRPRRKTGC